MQFLKLHLFYIMIKFTWFSYVNLFHALQNVYFIRIILVAYKTGLSPQHKYRVQNHLKT